MLPQQRAAIDRAASQEGVSRSTFVVAAAVEKAERLIAEKAPLAPRPRSLANFSPHWTLLRQRRLCPVLLSVPTGTAGLRVGDLGRRGLGDVLALEVFDCGSDILSNWLRNHARRGVRHGTGTYAVVDQRGQVLGYFSLAPHIVERDEVPRSIGRGASRQMPAILLAKFALDRSIRARGLGRELLIVAPSVIAEAEKVAGGKVVVVDAIDDAATGFYGHHHFMSIPGNPNRLVQGSSTVAAAVSIPRP